MKRKDYMKPTMCVVELQHRHQILAGSIQSTSTDLSSEDITISDTPQSIWGR